MSLGMTLHPSWQSLWGPHAELAEEELFLHLEV